MKKILLLTDFSDCSLAAAKYAKQLASLTQAKLMILHVFNPQGPRLPSRYYTDIQFATWIEENRKELEEKAKAELKKFEDFCLETDVDCEKIFLRGIIAEEIVNFIDSEDIDHVVMGRHGCTKWRIRTIGTNADYIIRNVTCSATLIAEEYNRE